MGVLKNGTAFLHQRGLAPLCGVKNAHIGTISTEWNDANERPRIAIIKDLLARRGDARHAPRPRHERRPDLLRLPRHRMRGDLEYYAFEAGTNYKEQARKNFVLAAKRRRTSSTRRSVTARRPNSGSWQQFHDRVSLVHDSVPMATSACSRKSPT